MLGGFIHSRRISCSSRLPQVESRPPNHRDLKGKASAAGVIGCSADQSEASYGLAATLKTPPPSPAEGTSAAPCTVSRVTEESV